MSAWSGFSRSAFQLAAAAPSRGSTFARKSTAIPVSATKSSPKMGNVSKVLGIRNERFFLEQMKDPRAPPNFHAYPIERISVNQMANSKPYLTK
mmetsp:Transcript_15903/g.28832  ORF Transcript_15903/g.28832 Transcript_15903/m.28832 type:complete len:94 (-) Transcript_15903:475-756(-)|eukprot:CAMPEP_0205926190 /NCGR_PEP_ID=MMETSP1325-20131115/19847_1 /ASSEMBLY_ACC=CAM_ASM_000708 /TAXON_ID=236786 /ORGANISM="Florenciella sp., Strain RCC1007" /LENGTH=93 /DNA_ID=CAMNT_0053294873 /DNA_START=81 /DNA_END=362 /DNA_ORIENTATION=+